MSVFAVQCPEKQFFVNATNWTDAFIQTCKLRAREFGIMETCNKDICIEPVNRFRTIYGEWIDFDKHTITTCRGHEIDIDDTAYFNERDGKRYVALMEYKGNTYPQDMALTIE